MRLFNFKQYGNVIRDSEFTRLGYVDTDFEGLLTYADNLKYISIAENNSNIACLITTLELANRTKFSKGLMVTDNPRLLFYKIHQYFIDNKFYRLPFKPYIGNGCSIHPSAVIAPGAHIGDNVRIAEQVVIRDSVWIGSNVFIEAGVKLGMEGILYNKSNTGIKLIPHGGYVRINDEAILMSNSVVVRSIHDTDVTDIGKGSLIGLGTIVGHEAKVGENVVVSNQCVLARRVVIGKNAFIGTQAMIKEHIHIAENARVMAGSVVIEDVKDGKSVSGNFATKHKDRMIEYFKRKI